MPHAATARRLRRTAALALLLVPFGPATARATCSQTLPPACAAREPGFDEQHEIDDCRAAIDAFQSATSAFASCLQQEANAAIAAANRATDSYNEVVRAFNARLQRSRAVRAPD